jgi:integrase
VLCVPAEICGGGRRYRVLYRLGGRESIERYGGSFATQKLALARRAWADRRARRAARSDLRLLEPDAAPISSTLGETSDRWRESRVDVADSTRVLHRVALDRVLPTLGERPVDEITAADVVELVSHLHGAGKKRETIRKSVKYLAAVLDYAGLDPNPARDRNVRLPYEETEELQPPTAEHVEAVFRTIPTVHRLPLLWLDWSGARVASVDKTRIADYDEPRRRVRLSAAASKSRRALWVELPEVLADAIEATMPPREDRDPGGRLFPASGADALRTSFAKACAALAIPVFSPHDLRHRRISLLHQQGRSWAEVGAFVGQRKLSITADVSHTSSSTGARWIY